MEKDGIKTFHAISRTAWREWLMAHHDIEKNLWLIIYKKQSGIPSVTYDEAVDEALCFGWIDSKINKRDNDSFFQFFARRNPKSNWSRVNKNKIEKLVASGLMMPSGYDIIEKAKKNGAWAALDDVENLINPCDLQIAFDANIAAQQNFDAFPRSVKRNILEWLLNAKQEATRQKRIAEIVSLAEKNERANQYIAKK